MFFLFLIFWRVSSDIPQKQSCEHILFNWFDSCMVEFDENPRKSSDLGLITYPRKYFGPVNIQKLQIQLLDEYGRIINLNNMDYSICLTMETIYDL
jgi:hypothetical protein